MTRRALIWSIAFVLFISGSFPAAYMPKSRGRNLSMPPAGLIHSKQQPDRLGWDISATASTLSNWIANQVLADYPDISARVLSVRDDGCFIDAGSINGVTAGQVFEIYRVPHGGGRDEVLGDVQISWTREDYSFALPRYFLDINEVTTLHFARLVNVPPNVSLHSGTSTGSAGIELDRLYQAIFGLLNVRGRIRVILGDTSEPTWKLSMIPDFEGSMLRAVLRDPGGEISSTISLDPFTGERLATQTWLDPSYITGAATPFEHFMAPPGRRMVRIACGGIIPGSADELAVLDGADLWIYDLTSAEPRLMSSLQVFIPPGPVRHRDDGGSLELVDLNGNGQVEICLAPPGEVEGKFGVLRETTGYSWDSCLIRLEPPILASEE